MRFSKCVSAGVRRLCSLLQRSHNQGWGTCGRELNQVCETHLCKRLNMRSCHCTTLLQMGDNHVTQTRKAGCIVRLCVHEAVNGGGGRGKQTNKQEMSIEYKPDCLWPSFTQWFLWRVCSPRREGRRRRFIATYGAVLVGGKWKLEPQAGVGSPQM